MYRSLLFSVPFLFTFACATGSGGPSNEMDSATPEDASGLDASDAAPTVDASDAAVEAGFVYDGSVPPDGALLFANVNRTGQVRLVMGDIPNLHAFNHNTASIAVPAGYTLYGTSAINYGGDLSEPFIGPTLVDDLGALANTWDAVIFRPSSEPVATVYRDVSAMPKVYPLGSFPSLGAVNDLIDGINLPAGVTFIGYDEQSFTGISRGPYVGPLNVGALPYRDMWSSFEVRLSTPADVEVGDVRLYKNGNYGGEMLVLTPGRYASLNAFPGLGAFNNTLSSMDGRNGLAVFGFQYGNYGGDVFGPFVSDQPALTRNDDWDSIVIQPVAAPTVTVFFDGGFTTPAIYPVIDVANLEGNKNRINGVSVPDGYVIQGFSHDDFGGTTGNAWIHPAGMWATISDDWDSFVVRPATEPTVTLYFAAGSGMPRTYPLASYPDLETANDQIRGANVPCGVRIRAFENGGFSTSGETYEVNGPTDTASVPGSTKWSSMIIEANGASCP